jgi:hypothetical protein
MKSTSKSPKHLSFHRLSGHFFGEEAVRHDATDFALFTLIAGLSAWPILSSIEAVARLLWS